MKRFKILFYLTMAFIFMVNVTSVTRKVKAQDRLPGYTEWSTTKTGAEGEKSEILYGYKEATGFSSQGSETIPEDGFYSSSSKYRITNYKNTVCSWRSIYGQDSGINCWEEEAGWTTYKYKNSEVSYADENTCAVDAVCKAEKTTLYYPVTSWSEEKGWRTGTPYSKTNKIKPVSVTVYCHPIIFKITLDNGQVISIKHGQTLPAVTVPTKKGYIFKGYYDSSGKQFYDANGKSSVVYKEGMATSLTAKWEAKTYTISLGDGKTVTATHDKVMPSITIPVKKGYTFKGYYDANGKQFYDTNGKSSVIYQDGMATSLTAKWEIKTFTIYLSDGKSFTIKHGEKMPAVTVPTKKGYNFLGYYDSSGKQYYDSQGKSSIVYEEGMATSLTAKYEAKTYTITLSEGSSVVATHGKSMPTIDVPTKKGYTFKGYFDSNGKQFYDSQGRSCVIYEDGMATSLTAKWEIKTFTIRFSDSPTLYIKHGEKMPSISVPTKKGYKFEGYYDSSGRQFYDSNGKSSVTYEDGMATSLEAKWEVIIYTITLSDGQIVKVKHGEKLPNVSVPTKKGNIFLGFYDSNGRQFYDRQGKSLITYEDGMATSLEAKWEVKTFTITLSDGKSFTIRHGDKMPTVDVPSKKGYKFLGYYDSSGKQFYDSNGKSSIVYEDGMATSLTAKWEEIIYVIDLGDGKIIKIKHGEKLPPIDVPTKKGYKFLGYYDDNGKQFYDENGKSTVVYEDGMTTKLTPKFEAKIFTIYLSDGQVVKVKHGETLPNIKVPKLTGYIFIGFFDFNGNMYYDSEGKSSVTFEEGMPATLGAKYKPISYVIKYVSNDSKGSTSSQSVDYDQEVIISPCGFTKEGYSFSYWQDDYGNMYEPNEKVKNITTVNEAEYKLHAVWKKDQEIIVNPPKEEEKEIIPTGGEIQIDYDEINKDELDSQNYYLIRVPKELIINNDINNIKLEVKGTLKEGSNLKIQMPNVLYLKTPEFIDYELKLKNIDTIKGSELNESFKVININLNHPFNDGDKYNASFPLTIQVENQ